MEGSEINSNKSVSSSDKQQFEKDFEFVCLI